MKFTASIAAGVLLAGTAAGALAMSQNEVEMAKIAAENVARAHAIYAACKADNVAGLKKAYLDFGARCGSNEKELKELGSFYDARLRTFEEQVNKREKQCSYSPSEARERADTVINKISGMPCKSQTQQ